MTIFKRSWKYYDWIYQDKDYLGEVEYIHSLIEEYNFGSKTILNLGCGTGKHDFLLADKKYEITGVDLSPEMIVEARKKVNADKRFSSLQFYHGDIREINLDKKFDNVIALFHVISYMNDNDKLYESFKNAYKHLNDNGIFIFDFWYGPGVLSDKPQRRTKKIVAGEEGIVRIAIPEMISKENCVSVNYEYSINDRFHNEIERFDELHLVRYFFYPELNYMLGKIGFREIVLLDWMSTKNEPDFNSWNALIVCKK